MNETEAFYYGTFVMCQLLQENTSMFDFDTYDDMWGISQKHYTRFLHSDYNVDSKSEYDCIVDYINAVYIQ